MQVKLDPKPKDLLQKRVDLLRELAAGQGAESFTTLIEMLRICETDAKERLVDADPEMVPVLQGEARVVRRLLKLLTQPRAVLNAGQ